MNRSPSLAPAADGGVHRSVSTSGGRAATATRRRRTASTRPQRGSTLLEALVAFVVFSFGALSIGGLQQRLRDDADLARQRSEAVRFGEQELEALRAFSVIEATADAHAYADIDGASTAIDNADGRAENTRYRLTRRIDAASIANAKAATIDVAWTDRRGAAQRVSLDSIIARHAPEYAGALAVAPARLAPYGAFGRAPSIPLAAKNLGNGRSVFKPVAAGVLAFAFDNASGAIVARCRVDAALATDAISAADLTGCSAEHAVLLSGLVRFAAVAVGPGAARSDAAAFAASAPLALDIVLRRQGGADALPPDCSWETVKTVRYATGGVTHIAALPLAATPAAVGAAAWDELDDRYVAYHCAITPGPSGRWSGRLDIAARGWTIGTGPADRRICPYSSNGNPTSTSGTQGASPASGSASINTPDRFSYVDVSSALTHQNFLVIAGPETCPV